MRNDSNSLCFISFLYLLLYPDARSSNANGPIVWIVCFLFRFVFGYSFDRCTLFYHFHVYCHWSRALCFYLMHRCFTCARLNCLGCDRFVFRKQLLVWNCERERGNICLLRIVHNYQMHKTHTHINTISVAVFLIFYSHAFNESRRDNLREEYWPMTVKKSKYFNEMGFFFRRFKILIEAIEILMVILLEKMYN